MPLGRWVARSNRYWINPVTRRIAPWAPGLGIVIHRGRASGRVYRTPVNVFRRDDGYLFALTYGADTDWVKNVLAAQGCELQTRQRVVSLAHPRLYRDERRSGMPAFVRVALRLLSVDEFLELKLLRTGEPQT